MENINRPRMVICAAVCGCNFIPQAETEIDMEMQERHHFTICMPCLSECGTATGNRLCNLALDNAPRNANAISTNMIANCSPVNRLLSCCPSNEIKLLNNLKTNGNDSTRHLRFDAPPSRGKNSTI
jgi:hypothetical protein